MKITKKLVMKALTDVQFRKMLEEKPMEALEMANIKGGQTEVFNALQMLNEIATQTTKINDLLFCITNPNGPIYA